MITHVGLYYLQKKRLTLQTAMRMLHNVIFLWTIVHFTVTWGVAQSLTQSRTESRDEAYRLVLSRQCSEARPLLQQALELYRQDRSDPSISQYMRHGSIIDEINILTRRAFCDFLLRDEQPFARSIVELIKVRTEVSRIPYLQRFANPQGGPFHEVAEWLDTWRGQFETDEEKKQAGERITGAFEEVIRFLVKDDNPDEALVVSENLRGRAFADLLASRPTLHTAMQSLGSERALPSPVTVTYIPKTKLLDLVAAHGSVTIEYHLLDDALLIWVITPPGKQEKRINMISVPGARRELELVIRSFVNLVQPPRQGCDNSPYRIDAAKLSQVLRVCPTFYTAF